MQYLIRNRKLHKIYKLAHLWINNDTVCRQASTKGLDINFYKVIDTYEGRVCKNCLRKKT